MFLFSSRHIKTLSEYIFFDFQDEKTKREEKT